MLHVHSHENFMLELRILKLHRKTILQTPSSDTPISFFFLLGRRSALENKTTNASCNFHLPSLSPLYWLLSYLQVLLSVPSDC